MRKINHHQKLNRYILSVLFKEKCKTNKKSCGKDLKMSNLKKASEQNAKNV
jgi:hypothetical protein